MITSAHICRPLQNRVLPDGEIVAVKARGSLMGNRGGKIHDPHTKKLLKRRWASRRWISCVLEFKNRHREVMGNGYTELFFLDEVAALSAGHRPCFECQRARANRFAKIWEQVHEFEAGSRADQMDMILHEARTEFNKETVSQNALSELPNGSVVKSQANSTNTEYYAKHSGGWLTMDLNGYSKPTRKDTGPFTILTPRVIRHLMQAGYEPIWHASAKSTNRDEIIDSI